MMNLSLGATALQMRCIIIFHISPFSYTVVRIPTDLYATFDVEAVFPDVIKCLVWTFRGGRANLENNSY